MLSRILVYMLILCSAIACRSAQEEKSIEVTVIADGRETTYSFARDLTVDQVLTGAQIELGPRDRISHPLVSPVLNGMRITIRRVSERESCEQEEIAHQRRLRPKEGLLPGEREKGEAGVNGRREICYRILLEDETEVDRVQLGSPTVIREPVDEVIYVGTSNTVQPLEIPGRLSYINHENAWTIIGNAASKRRLTWDHKLDAHVFHQKHDGARLIFTGETDETDEFFNELWMINLEDESEPARMTPTDVLFAQWRPRAPNEIAYSTGESNRGATDWKALNNLWLMSVDLHSGRTLGIEELLPESGGGLYGWWGKNFSWSPVGDKLAWARADGFGLVDLAGKRLTPLAQYAVFHSAATWVWLSPLSWSFDGQLLAGIVHGPPLADEPAETSPIFNLVVASADGRFVAPIRQSAGMWSAPAFSPDVAPRSAENKSGYLAWLQAREPHTSMSSEYDLMLADRDGSNQRRLFPAPGEPGIHRNNFGSRAGDYVWSPDGRFIALIYAGDLWLIEVETGAARQLTFDGESSNPIWTR
ncbi:MAG: G5 domain-containing protein [Chloroflexi bacterium]|nr:G5 domain-containing protein [Chloroflexota bacterium]